MTVSILQIAVIQIIAFLILAFLLYRMMVFISAVETRRLQKLIKENAQKAKDLEKKTEKIDDLSQQKLSEAEQTAKHKLEQSENDAKKMQENIRKKAEGQAEEIIQEAMNKKEQIRREIEAEIFPKSVAFSSQLIRKILHSRHYQALHEGIVEEICEDIEKLKKGRLHIPDSVTQADVETAFPMTNIQKEQLEKVLSSNLGKKIAVRENLNKEIIAGLVIKC